MEQEEFNQILENADTSLEEMTAAFRELTVEDFNNETEEMQALLATTFSLSEEDLSETELGQMFAEQAEEQEEVEQPEVSINESIVTHALEGNILETRSAFDQALADRINEKIDARREEVRSSLFEEQIDSFTIADVMEELGVTAEEMNFVAENMTEEEFEQLDEDNQALVAVYTRLFENAEGDEELLANAINEDIELVTELSRKTLGRYVRLASDDRTRNAVNTERTDTMNRELYNSGGDHDTNQKIDQALYKKRQGLKRRDTNRRYGIRTAVNKLTNAGQ